MRRLRGAEVAHRERNMGVAGTLFGNVPQKVGCVGAGSVEDEVDLHAAGVGHDGHGLGAQRSGDEPKAKFFVEGARAFQAMHADADMGDADDGRCLVHGPALL